MTTEAYDLVQPMRRTTSVVFSSPHSGRAYSAAFMARAILDERDIRSSEDAHVEALFASAPRHGAPLLSARVPRAFVDLNRAQDELDPALIDGVRRTHHSPRIASGLGVIPRVVAGGRPIYSGKLTLSEAEERLAQVWRPYHAALNRLLDESHAAFGEAVLIDCHSMPHEALEVASAPGATRPDVVLGDRFGAAAHADIVDRIEAVFVAAGLHVARNTPFAGAYVTQAYGRPARRQHAVQVEIDRSLYLDERSVRPGPGFAAFCRAMEGIVAGLAAIGRPEAIPVAAE